MAKIGLEIHGYLTTNEKLFCSCKAEHGLRHSKPNTNICPVCTAQPGAKPMLPNKKAVDKVIQIALILGCKKIGNSLVTSGKVQKRSRPSVLQGEGERLHETIKSPLLSSAGASREETKGSLVWQRKHYDWPDLPKGYQDTISGPYAIPVGEKGKFLGIRITECHLEEDPAAWNPKTGEIDYNRSGSPLVEIVTEPDFKNSDEAVEWLKQLITTLNYVKAIDRNSGIKADVNVSIPRGKRVEIKNINSLKNIRAAIEHEIQRQKKCVPKKQETRMFDESKGTTARMRTKEDAEDYRFISDPDLPIINIESSRVQEIKSQLPETPHKKLKKLINKHKIEKKHAEILTKKLDLVEFFEKIVEEINPKLTIPWITGELMSVLNYNKKELDEINLSPKHFIELLKLIENNSITELKAQEILRSWKKKSSSPKKHAKKHSTISGKKEIEKLAQKVIKQNPKAVEDFKQGEAKAMNFLIGQVMRLSDKRADYIVTKKILERLVK